jgi:uncharacterized protein YcbX
VLHEQALRLRVAQLFVYPVKACAGVAVPRLSFDAAGGVAGDRQWAVVDEEDVVTWQGAVPRLALVRPHPVPGGLVLQAPGMPLLYVDAADSRGCEVRLWNEAAQVHELFPARRAHGDASAWLLQATGARLRLVQLGEAALRRDTLNPVHLVSARSLAALNEDLQADGSAAVAVQRFRPNIVIDGDALEPFDEDLVRCMRWPEARVALQVMEPCVRCVVVNVDPQTGEAGHEPLALLGRLRAARRPGAPVTFGVYARAAGRGTLELGDLGGAEFAF